METPEMEKQWSRSELEPYCTYVRVVLREANNHMLLDQLVAMCVLDFPKLRRDLGNDESLTARKFKAAIKMLSIPVIGIVGKHPNRVAELFDVNVFDDSDLSLDESKSVIVDAVREGIQKTLGTSGRPRPNDIKEALEEVLEEHCA